jgi:hypothetical protein
MHSLQYKDASEHMSKRVFIIGCGTSAHDIATDHGNQEIGTPPRLHILCSSIDYKFRVDVTIFQRSPIHVMSPDAKTAMSAGIYCEDGPPTDVADCLNASFPTAFMVGGLSQRMTASLAEMDKFD